MNAIKLSVLCALLLVGAFSTGASAATDPLSKANRLPPSLEQKVQDFQSAVINDGYDVARGYWDLWSTDDCKYPLQSVGFCYGNNPTAPYVLAFLPPWKDEFVDKSLKHTIAQERKGMNPNYRLGEREAVVILAELPPPARYFGIGTNVFTRQAELNTEDPVYEILDHPETQDLKEIIFGGSPNPDRMMMIATVGDTINNVDIEEQSKENWGQQRFFVITPDEDMADAMKVSGMALGGLAMSGAVSAFAGKRMQPVNECDPPPAGCPTGNCTYPPDDPPHISTQQYTYFNNLSAWNPKQGNPDQGINEPAGGSMGF